MPAVAPTSPLGILHHDVHCVVAVKPSGLLSVPGRGADRQDCLAARVRAAFDDALVVHRLDMATSGLMLFARGAEMQRRLSHAFAQREVHKRYVAVVHGSFDRSAGEIDLPLIADWPNRPRQKVDPQLGKPSLTRYRVLESDAASDTTRVELEPVTGRAHQLRVHLLAIGHGIVGDALYGSLDASNPHARLLLHATSLRFAHPQTGEIVKVDSAVPF